MAMSGHFPSDLVQIVSQGLREDSLAGIREILRLAAASMDSMGSILWQLDLGADLEARPPIGRLFLFAQWFDTDRIWAFDDLPLTSAAGEAVCTGKPVNVTECKTDPRIDSGHPIVIDAGVETLCSVPLYFSESERGALNFFRRQRRPFTREELRHASEIATLVADLCRAIRDKASFHLMLEIHSHLHQQPRGRNQPPLDRSQIVATLKKIADSIATAFHCYETSIFLEDRLDDPGLFRKVATTWERGFSAHDYRADLAEGLTGWVLARGLPVRILDLWHFRRDHAAYQDRYKGIVWQNFMHIDEEGFRKLRGLRDSDFLLPLSFLAVPVLLGDRVLGVIRCSIATSDPNYFSNHEEEQLKLAAAQVAPFWNEWIEQRERESENRSWLSLVENIKELNRIVAEEVSKPKPDEKSMFLTSLARVKASIPGAAILDVSLIEEESNQREFVATDWAESIGPDKIFPQWNNRVPLGGKAAEVIHGGTAQVMPSTDENTVALFPEAKSAILAPIVSGSKVYGILAARSLAQQEFPLPAIVSAGLIGQQLGLYHFLFLMEQRLRENERLQSQTYEDFRHQIKTPLIQAYLRTQALSQAEVISSHEILRKRFNAIRGLLRKADRVSNNIGLFVDLAKDGPICMRSARLSADDILRLLSEATTDTEATMGDRRKIGFRLRRGGFSVLNSFAVQADRELLEQAVMNLLDNAVKYSFDNTTVEIYGGLTGSERFYIAVTNKGLRLTAADARNAPRRNWRSKDAQYTTGEGSGIGLWIVDNIMKSHGGDLLISPTNSDGIVEVRLIFPGQKVSR
jgi:signal transduction histidine kinase